jgi:DNA-binding SARP family transcriptional activator
MSRKVGRLSVRLLGRFKAQRDGVLLDAEVWGRRKTQTLLKLLLTRRDQVFTTDQILDALYPDRDPQKAAGNLRTRISELRRALEPELQKGSDSQYVLHVSPGHYCFSESAPCQIDTELFEEHLEAARKLTEQERWAEALGRYEAGIALYRGDLLADDRYAEWALAPRERFSRLFGDALEGASVCHARLGCYERAIAMTRRLIEREPARECAYRRLMRYELYRGKMQRALQAYESCVKALRKHLDMAPSSETQELRDRILEGNIPRRSVRCFTTRSR